MSTAKAPAAPSDRICEKYSTRGIQDKATEYCTALNSLYENVRILFRIDDMRNVLCFIIPKTYLRFRDIECFVP